MARTNEKALARSASYKPGSARSARQKRKRPEQYAEAEARMRQAKGQSAAARAILAKEAEDVDTVKFREGKF